MAQETCYSIAPGWEVVVAERNAPSVLLGGYGRYLRIKGLSAQILANLSQVYCSAEDLIQLLRTTDGGEEITVEAVTARLEALHQKHIILSDLDDLPSAFVVKQKHYFTYQLRIFSEQQLLKLTKHIAPFYSPYLIWTFFPLLATIHLAFWTWFPFSFAQVKVFPNGTTLLLVVVINYVGLFLHECGHAAACIKSGVRHGAIGGGLYLFYPCFFTDVSNVWLLPRSKRMLVDVSGMYTTLMLSTVALAIFLYTQSYLPLLITALYDTVFIINLNPFVRMDAYWLLCDATCIDSLMAHNREIGQWLLHKLRGKSPVPAAIWFLSPKKRAFCIGYCLFSSIFIIFASCLLARWVIADVLPDLPLRFLEISHTFGREGFTPFIAGRVFQLLLVLLSVTVAAVYLSKSLVSAIRIARRVYEE